MSYILKHFFRNLLGVPVTSTTKVDEFVAHNGPKITYSNNPLGKEFFIRSTGLLFEQGIGETSIHIRDWEDVPAFYYTGEHSDIPFDIFAAAFFLLSRYEEYQPYVPDSSGRFPAGQSVAFDKGFLDIPVIDLWAMKFKEKLSRRFPGYSFPTREFSVKTLIEVNEAYAYKHKGILRTAGGYAGDIFRLRFKNLVERTATLLRLKEDPYFIYKELLDDIREHRTDAVFFFLFSEFTTFDTNVSSSNHRYRLLIKRIIDYVPFGQLFSYYTAGDQEKMLAEKKRLESLAIRPVTKSRQHRSRVEIPGTYQHLVDAGIEEEYSMGYETHCGFRAGTCTPFYFYDLDYEIQTPLKIFPVAVSDRALMDVKKYTPAEARLHMEKIRYRVRQAGGQFIMSIRNASLSAKHPRWKELFYQFMHHE